MGDRIEDTENTREDESEVKPNGTSPMVSVKTVGQAARRFDDSLTKGLAAAFGGAFSFFSNSLRRLLQSGHWQNYAFIIFAALIFAAAALVLILTYWR
ncbi:MAG: hypothetical protein C4521_07125 [Actinobacteria bacterium]|nr:MAG: hypothetical protein C4521_07125 [Actinomycetota bacterium]